MTRRFLNNYFSCHSKIDILRTVINSEQPLSGRQIAARAGLSPRSCQLSLDELVKLNALSRAASGKAYYYTLNVENQIVTDLIIPIIQQEERLTDAVVDTLRDKFGRPKKAVKGIYYLETWPKKWGGKGDSARLLAVLSDGQRPAELERSMEQSCDLLLKVFGLPAGWMMLSREDFSELVQQRPADLEKIGQRLRDVSGEQFRELLRKEKGTPAHLRKTVNFFPTRKRASRE